MFPKIASTDTSSTARFHFFKKYGRPNQKYRVKDLGEILSVECILPEDCEFSRLKLLLTFPRNSITIKIITDDHTFRESFFYEELMETEKYKDIWKLIKEKNNVTLWVEKMVDFIQTPNTVILWDIIGMGNLGSP